MVRYRLWIVGLSCLLGTGCAERPAAQPEGETPAPAETAPEADAAVESTSERLERQTKETLGTAREFAEEKTAEWRVRFQDELIRMDQYADELQQEMQDARVAAEPKVRAAYENLQTKLADARAKLESGREMSAEAWEKTQQDLDAAAERLKAATEAARQELEAEPEPAEPAPAENDA